MATKKQLIFEHDRELSALALWWKAIFLTPFWSFIFIMPLGALVRTFLPSAETPVFVAIISAALFYFYATMLKRSVKLGDKEISHGLTTLKVQDLEKIELGCSARGTGVARLPDNIRLQAKNSGQIVLSLHDMDARDCESLIGALGRRVTQLKVEPEVEGYLISRRPLQVNHIDNPDQVDLPYHTRRLVEDLPQIFIGATKQWARLVGPVGTLLICSPIWLLANLVVFNLGRDYSDVSSLRQFYQILVDILSAINYNISAGLSHLEMLFTWLAESPVALIILAPIISAAMAYGLRISISPNRLTLTRQYISLDFWSYLHCHTQAHVNWSRITQIALTEPTDSADPTKRSVVFSDDKKTLLEIPMSNLEPEDRSRLLHAIEKFAPQIKIQATLIEALTPSQDKSYTELWLQSLNSSNTVNLEPLEGGHSLLNRYVVEQKLAVGGEGIAYLARDLKDLKEGIIELAPQVVLKETLIPPYVDRDVQKESVERFEREARLLKELHSQYIVGLRDYFIEDKRCYLVLDYVQGKSLRRLVESEGALSTQRVLELARQMADILTFLHSKGVVHRDFTPDNLILQENGELKLIDFNVASDQGDGKTGTIVGKHAYVPAEQFRGKANKQSDIYALGATLFFLKEGRDPEPISQSKLPQVAWEPEQESAQESDQVRYQLLSKIVKECTALALKDRLKSSEALSELLSTNDQGHTIKISEFEENQKEKEPVLRQTQAEQELAAENS